jgi:tmRNA-binding protein
VPKKKPRRRAKMLAHRYEVKAEISNATLAKARSALSLQIYLRHEKLGEIQIGRGSLFWAGARRQSAKRIHWGRFAEMMDRLAYGDP